MVSLLKIVAIAMLLLAIDLFLQLFIGGGVVIQGTEYTLVPLLFFFFQLIVTFGGVIIHGLTHWNMIFYDIELLLNGILALIFLVVRSIAEIYFHLITFPFVILGWFADQANIGLGFKIDIGAIGGILFDLRTLTLQIQFGNIDGLDILGVKFYIKNTIGFSLMGTASSGMRAFDGNYYSWYKSGMEFLSITLDFKDGAETCFPDLIKIGQCILDNLPPLRNPLVCLDPSNKRFRCTEIKLILETPSDLKVLNLWNGIQGVFDSIPLPTLRSWMDDTWRALGFGVLPSTQGLFDFIKFKYQMVID